MCSGLEVSSPSSFSAISLPSTHLLFPDPLLLLSRRLRHGDLDRQPLFPRISARKTWNPIEGDERIRPSTERSVRRKPFLPLLLLPILFH